MDSLGFKLPEELISRLLKKCDKNEDYTLDFGEFFEYFIIPYTDKFEDRDLKMVFKLFSGDDNFITETELK